MVGVALALEREGVWILSLFAVDEEYRGAGVGRRLLDRALGYTGACKGAMLASSTHPAAMRRYALAGFGTPHARGGRHGRLRVVALGTPGAGGYGRGPAPRRRSRSQLRGAAHGPDLEFMLQTGCRFFVAERRAGRGYALVWEGSPAIVAATTPEVAKDLLWSCLA